MTDDSARRHRDATEPKAPGGDPASLDAQAKPCAVHAGDVAFFVDALNAMTDMVLIKGDQSKLLWANSAFLECYGMTQEQLRDIVDAPHSDPDDTLQYLRDDHEVFTSGRTLDIPYETVTDSQGGVHALHTTKSPIRDAAGNVIRSVGVSRKRDEDAVTAAGAIDRDRRKDALAELRLFVSSIPSVVAMFDAQQHLVAFSGAWQLFFGNAEVANNYGNTFEGRLPIAEEMAAVVRSGQPQKLSGAITRNALICDVDIQPWTLPNGSVGGSLVLISDVTAARRHEQQLDQANTDLLQFNYRASHDLLGPLATIHGLARAAQGRVSQGADPILDHTLMHIADSATRLSELVQNLRRIARVEATIAPPQDCSLAEIATSLAAAHADELKEAGVTLTSALEVEHVHGERTRLVQILGLLISNAAAHVDSENPDKRVHFKASEKDGIVSIAISDNGVGVDPALADTIFDQFVRGTSTSRGAGLGLYLARKQAHKLGGTLRLTSMRHDTTFELKFPQG